MTESKPELSPNQQKQIFAENLSGLQWWNGGNYMNAPLPKHVDGLEIKQGLELLGLKNVHYTTSDEDHRKLEATGYGSPNVTIDEVDNNVLVEGIENIKKLAKAGVKFPGSQVYSEKGKSWSAKV